MTKILHFVARLRSPKYTKPVLLRGAAILVILLLSGGFGGLYIYQNQHAVDVLNTAKRLDNTGHYVQASQLLRGVHTALVRPSTTKQIAEELTRNQQLSAEQQKIAEIQKLLREHKTQAALSMLKSLNPSSGNNAQANQLSQLRTVAQQQTASNANQPASSSGGSSSNSGSSGGDGGGSSNPSPSPSPPPPPGPLTAITVNSFTASSSPATASTCNINDSLSFGVNGSGTVTTTWKLISSRTTSEINNPTTFSFSAAGTQTDSYYFNATQGLESGDSYQVSVIITSTANSAITTTAGPVTISSCASPPSLASETEPANMTSITPSTPVIYQSQDSIFPNECSVNVQTPYSVNSSGTVEAIVMVTSASSGGYTYYDKNGATGFTGSDSATDSAYLRLPHLNAGDHFSVVVKLVEVSTPNTVYATTTAQSIGCD